MQNKFCKILSNSLSFRIPGSTDKLTFNPCCLYNDYIPFDYETFHKEREKYLNATNFLPGCSKCKLKEKTHGFSLRTRANDQLPNDIGSDIYKLEIVLDTTCNAACIQCGPLQSSLWRKELGIAEPKTDMQESLKIIKSVLDINKVGEIHFWGGEPFVTDTHLKIISDIVDPSSVEVRYTTNGSVFPDNKLWRILENFKTVNINVSVDGIGDQFHYIRWPLGWDKITNNLLRYKNESSSNTSIHINHCILPINALYVKRFEDWFAENLSYINKNKVSVGLIKGEGTMSLNRTPIKLREKIYSTLGEDHIVSHMLKEISFDNTNFMLDHLENLDKKRNLNWRKIFQESSEYL
jgi:hypothetical protein